FGKYQNFISKTEFFLQHFEFRSHANNWSQCKNGIFKHQFFTYGTTKSLLKTNYQHLHAV
ncbi:hypothetical protein P3372_27360, partial [Vibrio parahaemolyticus]|nr:hypothetical protein [Vibrio parahaemolyticus]